MIPEFLTAIWRKQPAESNHHVFTSAKDWSTGDWSEMPHPADHLPVIPTIHEDLYFCPNLFTESRRLRKYASPGRWLYADLDEVQPDMITPWPTVAWETSPGRYQAMWLLDRPLPPRRLEQLNQKLTYHTKADKGGWSLTKVLRVPGSTSTKYGEPFTVKLLWSDGKKVYSASDLNTLLRDVDTAPTTDSSAAPTDLPDRETVFKRRRRKLPLRARQLLDTTMLVPADDRSTRLWELENLLLDGGCKPEEVLVLVQPTIWNKYKGQRREVAMLWREINKAASMPRGTHKPKQRHRSKARTKKPAAPKGNDLLPNTLTYAEFMRKDFPRPEWLVEHIWGLGVHGLLAGEYKAFKTYVALELAVSVAAGVPFLQKFPVLKPGGVCYIHEEGRPGAIQERLEHITQAKGLTHYRRTNGDADDPAKTEIIFRPDIELFEHLPIHLSSMPGLDLTDEDDQDRVLKHVAATQPRLVIFETFYLLAGSIVDESIGEVRPVLNFLTRLSLEYGCAVIISHHFHKASDDKRHQDRVSGSNIFSRWYESAIFVERVGEEEDNRIVMRTAHRDGGGVREQVQFIWDSEQDSYLVEFIDPEDASKEIVNLARPESTIHPSDLPITLMAAKKKLGMERTSDVIKWARSQGIPVESENGVRWLMRERSGGA